MLLLIGRLWLNLRFVCRLGLALVMSVLVLMCLFLPCVRADVQLNYEFVDPVKNWSFERVTTSVYNASDWSTNNGGSRALRGDIAPAGQGDRKVDIQDVSVVSSAFGSVGPNFYYPGSPPSPNWNTATNPNGPDMNGDNKVDIQDTARVSSQFGFYMGNQSQCLDGSYSWYTSGGVTMKCGSIWMAIL